MGYRLATLLIVVGFGSLLHAAEWSEIVQHVEHRVPRVEILREGQTEPTICSGVFINAAAGYVLTAGHCVESSDRLDITVRGRDAAVVRYNRILDLGVLRVEPKKDDQTVPLAPATPPVGTPLAIVGHAFGYKQLTVTFGRISMMLDDDQQLLRVDANLIPGQSGGALLDDQGRLVGLASAVYYIGPAHQAALVPVETIADYVRQYLPVQ